MDLVRTGGGLAIQAIDAGRAAVGSGRPRSLDISLAARVLEGVPADEAGALAVVRQHFRLGPAPTGIIELQLPPGMVPMQALAGPISAPARGSLDGSRLLLEVPREGGPVTLRGAVSSLGSTSLRSDGTVIELGDLAARVTRGAEVLPPPPHHRTGAAQPDELRVLLRSDDRGWEFSSPIRRSGPDYVSRLDETVQAHFVGPRDEPFTATATYTGRVDGRAVEGPVAEARRGLRRIINDVGITFVHGLEQLRHRQ